MQDSHCQLNTLINENIKERVRRDNCFDFIRYFFAFSLIIVHFCTATDTEQFWFVTGGTRVKAFFIITGFLVVYSYIRRNSLKVYFQKRARRILPAYIVNILFCFIVGICLTERGLSEYFSDIQTYKYLLANLTFQNYIEPCLPGVFTQNPMPFLNASLWSMKVEMLFYLCVPFFVYAMKCWGKPIIIVTIFILSILWNELFDYLYNTTGREIYNLLQHQLGGQMIYFFGGTTLLLYFDKFCQYLKWLFPVCLVLYILSSRLGIWQLDYIEPLTFATIIIGTAYYCRPLNFLQRYDNISYGLYLYHFPVIQIFIHFGLHERNIILTFILAFLTTVFISLLSWKYIEKPIMNYGKDNSSTTVQNAGNTR